MKVIRQKSPGVHRQGLRSGQPGQPLDEILPISVILKDPLPLDPPRHHMVQHTGSIQAGTARHSAMLTIARISPQRPLVSRHESWKHDLYAYRHHRPVAHIKEIIDERRWRIAA